MIKSWLEQLKTLQLLLQPLDIHLSAEQIAFLNQYLNILVSWNARTNLISKNDVQHLVERHILESMAVVTVHDIALNAVVMDLGSGAGFPGIPLKILRPDLEIRLIDSKRMKYLFLKEIIRQLHLNKADAICERVESLDATFINYFDFVVCRAVTKLSELWGWSSKFLKTGGKLLAMKGGDLTYEFIEFQQHFPAMHFEIFEYPAVFNLNKSNKKLIKVTKEA